MTGMNDPKIIADYLHCLSRLENNTFLLYQSLAGKAEAPLVKTLLFSIAQDSSKHSALLKGVADSIAVSKEKTKDCAKKLGETWQMIDTLLKENASKEKMSRMELQQLIEKLTALESSAGEEYYIFIQMKTLRYMVKEINQLYNINLERFKNIFVSIIEDEEHHRELLTTIKKLLNENKRADQRITLLYSSIKTQTP
jgi:rubrerythrin